MNPFVSGFGAGEQLAFAPENEHLKRQQLSMQKKAQAQAALYHEQMAQAAEANAAQAQAYHQAQLAQQAPLVAMRTKYYGALAGLAPGGGPVTPTADTPIPVMQTGQPETTVPAAGAPGAPVSAPPPSAPVSSSDAAISQFSTPPVGATETASTSGAPASIPISAPLRAAAGARTATKGALQMPPGSFVNPLSRSRYSYKGAQYVHQNPLTKQVYAATSMTPQTTSFLQSKHAAMAELSTVSPILEQAMEDYGGNPLVTRYKLTHDIMKANLGDPQAMERLTNYGLAERVRPDIEMLTARGAIGSKPGEATMHGIGESQYSGLANLLHWLPFSALTASEKRYEATLHKMSSAGQVAAETGGWQPISSKYQAIGGMFFPADTAAAPATAPIQIPKFKTKAAFTQWYRGLTQAQKAQFTAQTGGK